jgi:acetyl-CoA carboxylase biotin carboxyl carrier protein
MDLELVERLLKLLSDSSADEIEIEEEGKRVKVSKHRVAGTAVHEYGFPAYPAMAPRPEAPPVSSAGSATPAPAPVQTNLHEIRSPIVGTFYRAPAPDAAPFVEAGSLVHPGTVLCIVEAMKLMNEIESDIEGKIARVLIENGQAVEYDQPLFLIEKL